MTNRLRCLALGSAFLLAFPAGAQSPFAGETEQDAKGAAAIGGKSSLDLIRLDGGVPNVPLRNAGVVPGSETLDLDGRSLKRGTDYAIDNAAGIVYLMRSFRPGQSLRASYRFDPSRAAAPTANMLGKSGLQLNFAGGNKLMLGFGVAERLQDGTVVASNVYGYKNNFVFGKGASLGGMMVLGEQRKVQSQSLLDYQESKANVEEGKSQAIVQNLGMGLLGGQFSANYQDVSKKFAGFQAFRDAGFDANAVNQLQKERGLKRAGFAFNNVGVNGLRIGSNFQSVRDGESSIDWRSYSINTGALQANWESRRVASKFARFNDLAEGDRAQLAKERGLETRQITGALNALGGKTSFKNLEVENEPGEKLLRRNFGYESKGLTLSYGDQHVQKGFAQFGGVREADAGQLAREQGIKRQSMAMAWSNAPFGLSMSASSSWLRSEDLESGTFRALDWSVGGKNWNWSRWDRSADENTGAMAQMSEGEAQGHIKSIARMYEPGDLGTKPEERNWLFKSSGLRRTGERMSLDFGKGTGFSYDTVALQGLEDKGTVQRAFFSSPRFKVAWRDQDLGSKLAEVGQLMEFERARVGSIAGVKKIDLDVSMDISKNRKVAFSLTEASREGESDASRQSLSVQDKGFDFSMVRRSVDSSFASVGQLVDREKEFLNTIRGMDQSQMKLKWNLYRGLKLDLDWADAKNDETGYQRMDRRSIVDWDVDRFTKLSYFRSERQDDDPLSLLFANTVERWGVSRNFGKLGAVAYVREDVDFDGEKSDQPDSSRSTLTYEAKLNPTTSVRTEQTKTEFENGERESISAHTLSTSITKNAGVSVTELRVNRDGDKPDEQRRNYGFWWQIGKNMRLDYGYQRDLNSNSDGQMKSSTSLTPGQIGGLAVGSASYNEQRWDNSRYMGTGNLQLSSVKPLQFGILKDLTFRFGADTHRDKWRFQRENRNMGLGAKVFGAALGWEYFSQVAPTGERAIDRLFKIQTDPSESKPYRASLSYKVRTLPSDQQVMIRSYSFTARPAKGFEITHQLLTNPEVARGDVILGSLPQAQRINKWKLDFLGGQSTKVGLSWDELINEQAKTMSRTGGVNVTLFANNPSPLSLYYGLEQGDNQGARRTAHRYNLRFDQKPGANQLLSLFVGNVSWQHSRAQGTRIQNWALRAEYQLKF